MPGGILSHPVPTWGSQSQEDSYAFQLRRSVTAHGTVFIQALRFTDWGFEKPQVYFLFILNCPEPLRSNAWFFFSKPFGHQPFTAAASIATIRALGEHSPLLRPIVGFFVIQTYIIQTQRSEWYNTRGATSNINLHIHIMTAAFLFQPSLCNRYIRIFTIKAEKLHEHCERNQNVSQNLTD